MVLTTLTFAACKKEKLVVPNNTINPLEGIPSAVIENYVNRLFIDLIGREPLDIEMDAEVAKLKENDLNEETRIDLIRRLQLDTTFVEGDGSYSQAYYHRFYELSKVRMIEAASNGVINQSIGNLTNGIFRDSLEGDSVKMQIGKAERQKLIHVIEMEEQFMRDSIDIREVFARLVNNAIYDQINMNTFNFINATFDNLYFRFPTKNEFNASYEMIQNNVSTTVLGKPGQNKGDYIEIVSNSLEFYQGIIMWMYTTLMSRSPDASEINAILPEFVETKNFQWMQEQILKTDEYANFD
jgi:hypothetical protein